MVSPQLQSIVVVDISVMAHWQIPMVVEFLQLQYIDMVIDVCCAAPAVRVQTWRSRSSSHSCIVDAGRLLTCLSLHRQVETVQYTVDAPQLALIDWLVFLGPCTQVHGQGSPAIRAGKGGGDAGSLLPGVLPPN